MNERGETMTLEKVIKMLECEYEKAKKKDFVKRPLAYALLEVWIKVDSANEDALQIEREQPKKQARWTGRYHIVEHRDFMSYTFFDECSERGHRTAKRYDEVRDYTPSRRRPECNAELLPPPKYTLAWGKPILVTKKPKPHWQKGENHENNHTKRTRKTN